MTQDTRKISGSDTLLCTPTLGAPWGGWEAGSPSSPASGLTTPHLPVFTFFTAEERPLRPAGPPLSAQPSRPCSTRLQGTVFWGGSSCTHSGLGPATAPPCWDQAPRGQACPFLPSPSAHKEGEGGKEAQTNRTWGLCTLGRGGSLVSRTETASLGPSGKKGPG